MRCSHWKLPHDTRRLIDRLVGHKERKEHKNGMENDRSKRHARHPSVPSVPSVVKRPSTAPPSFTTEDQWFRIKAYLIGCLNHGWHGWHGWRAQGQLLVSIRGFSGEAWRPPRIERMTRMNLGGAHPGNFPRIQQNGFPLHHSSFRRSLTTSVRSVLKKPAPAPRDFPQFEPHHEDLLRLLENEMRLP
jgi:hypothetical protein